MAEKLKKLGVETVRDLIYYFPRDYADYTQITKIGDLGNPNVETRMSNEVQNQNVTIKAKIINIANRRTSRRRFVVTEAVVTDDTGSIKVVWFNQPYLEKMLKAGSEVILNGKISYDNFSGQLQMESPTRTNFPRIVPIYPETVGISSAYIGKLLKAISYQLSAVREYIPEEVIKKNQLLPIQESIKLLHFPTDSASIEKARERMAFDELFLFSLQKQLIKQEVLIHKAPKMSIDEQFLKDFVESLPFKLTDAQRKSSWRIIKDLESDQPMNRLLNGDVGSGKTVVAAFAAAVVIKNGKRVALMAPTEILANQHYQTLSKVLQPHGISIGLITSASQKLKAASCQLSADIVIGTHALIQEKVELDNIGLVIIDEQHRFGVNQRNKLLEARSGLRPHFLSMTATPIPRTMSLVVFADLDVSVIDEMPADRKKIITRIVGPAGRAEAYDFIRKEVSNEHQVFVICPLIAEGDQADSLQLIANSFFEEEKKAVIKEAKRLQKDVFPDLKIAMLHGKLKSKEKEAIMSDFKAKKFDILVSTSVVEVGVDIPGATVMMIENAESFGLAQLHQFRGRVGRNDMQSYCLLFSSSNSENARLRLSYMEKISSGFELAEKDLELRGPGQMYGYVQSGFWDFRFADIGDRIMIEKATEAAKDVVGQIDKYPELLEKVGESAKHLE